MIIAVDGTAASGKGTLAKALAARLNLAHLDTGALYRACALVLLEAGFTPTTVDSTTAGKVAESLDLTLTHDARIRSDEVGAMASLVSTMPEVRAAFLTLQRNFAERGTIEKNGAILDGRDIGTVILPHADFKFFVDAKRTIRAERRYKELRDAGNTTTISAVSQALEGRDKRDRNRTHAPLKPADDAIFIDTSTKSVNEMVETALAVLCA